MDDKIKELYRCLLFHGDKDHKWVVTYQIPHLINIRWTGGITGYELKIYLKQEKPIRKAG